MFLQSCAADLSSRLSLISPFDVEPWKCSMARMKGLLPFNQGHTKGGHSLTGEGPHPKPN